MQFIIASAFFLSIISITAAAPTVEQADIEARNQHLASVRVSNILRRNEETCLRQFCDEDADCFAYRGCLMCIENLNMRTGAWEMRCTSSDWNVDAVRSKKNPKLQRRPAGMNKKKDSKGGKKPKKP